jgi:hypothetical protein
LCPACIYIFQKENGFLFVIQVLVHKQMKTHPMNLKIPLPYPMRFYHLTQTETDLQAAKQDRSPADGIIYGLKDGAWRS